MTQIFDSNLKNIAGLYIQLLHVRVTTSTVTKDIEENPYYPSLLSLSNTFNRYHIINKAFEIAPEHLGLLEPPFVAYVNVPGIGKDFVLVRNMTGETVSYSYKSRKSTTLIKEEFLKQYRNIIWAAEPDQNSGEIEYDKKLKHEKAAKNKKIAGIVGFGSLLLFFVATSMNTVKIFSFCSIATFKLIGTTTAILLLVYETDKNNFFVKNICSAGGQTNCDAVLGSKASKILGVSWGEIGFFYFAATTIWLLLPSAQFADKIAGIAIANAFAAPYILFSIYYQAWVVKQWCPLCLTIQTVLLSEFIWSIIYFWAAPLLFRFNIHHLFSIIFCILIPILSWYTLKPFFAKAKDAELYKSAYKRVQYNPDIFNDLLRQQAKAPDGWKNLGIGIGNPAATNTIIKVCNPYCGPCARTHPILEDIIRHDNNTQLKIIFTAKNKEHDSESTVVKHLLAIADEDDATKTQQSLDDWYLADTKNYNYFAKKYPLNSELECQSEKIEAMSKWCEEAEIRYTPTIFVNGHRLPENYNVEELKYIL